MCLICDSCGSTFGEEEHLWKCPCGGYLSFREDMAGTFDRIRIASGPENMWRYSEMLPLKEESHPVSMGEGLTPLVRAIPSWIRSRTERRSRGLLGALKFVSSVQ